MLDEKMFVDAVVERTGMDILAQAEGYCAIGEGSVPRVGILCGVAGGLVFIAERRGSPGAMHLWGKSEIKRAQVNSAGSRAGLSFFVEEKAIVITGLPQPPLARIVAAAGLSLHQETVDSLPAAANLQAAVVSTTPAAAVAPPATVGSGDSMYGGVPSLVGSASLMESAAGLLSPQSLEFVYGSEDTSAPPTGASIYGGGSSLMESSVGMGVGNGASIYGGAPSLIESSIGVGNVGGTSIYGGGSSLFEASVGTGGLASEPGSSVNYGDIGGPLSLLESTVGDYNLGHSGHIHEVVPSMIETQIEADELREIQEEIRKREKEARKAAQPKTPTPKPIAQPPALPKVIHSEPVFGLPASALLQDPEDLEFLDANEIVVIEGDNTSYELSLERFVSRIEDGNYGPDVHFRLKRSKFISRLGDTPLYQRLSPRAQEFEDVQQPVSVKFRTTGRIWRYVGLGIGAFGGMVFASGLLPILLGGFFGYLTGRIFGAIVAAASR